MQHKLSIMNKKEYYTTQFVFSLVLFMTERTLLRRRLNKLSL